MVGLLRPNFSWILINGPLQSIWLQRRRNRRTRRVIVRVPRAKLMLRHVSRYPTPHDFLFFGGSWGDFSRDPDKWATTINSNQLCAVGGSAVGGRAVKPPTCIGARVNGRSAPESHGIPQPVVGDDGLKNEMKS